MDLEYENVRSAVAWSQTTACDPEVALRLTAKMTHLYGHRGRRHDAIVELERTLNHPLGLKRTFAQGHIHHQLALLLALTGNYAAAQLQYVYALEIARELGYPRPQATILSQLGWLAREQGDGATAWARLTESLAIIRTFNNAVEIAGTLNTLAGVAILEEDPTRAETLLEESLAISQGAPADPLYTGWTLNHRGHVAQLRGEYGRAMQLHQESLLLFPSDYHAGLLWAYHGLGEATLGDGQPGQAAHYLAQGLRVAQVVSDQPGVIWCLAGLGSAAALSGQAERAGCLWGAAERLQRMIGCRPAPAARTTYERALAHARAQLGEAAFAAAWAAGQALTLEQAIGAALEGSTVPARAGD